MARFGSKEWLDLVQTRFNGDENLQGSGSGLTADFQYVVQPDDGLAEAIEMGWRIEGGKCTATWQGIDDADFVFVGPYQVFKRVNTGQTAAMEVMMSGELQIQGEQSELMGQFAAVDAMQQVLLKMNEAGETDWPA